MVSLIVMMVCSGCKTTESLTPEQHLEGLIVEITPERSEGMVRCPNPEKEVWFGYNNAFLLVQDKDTIQDTGHECVDSWDNELMSKKIPIYDAFGYPMIVYEKRTKSWAVGYPQLGSDLRGSQSGFGNQVGGAYGDNYTKKEPVWLVFVQKKGTGKAASVQVKFEDGDYLGLDDEMALEKLKEYYGYGYWFFSKDSTYSKYEKTSPDNLAFVIYAKYLKKEYDRFPLRFLPAVDVIMDTYEQVKGLSLEEGRDVIEANQRKYNPEGKTVVQIYV